MGHKAWLAKTFGQETKKKLTLCASKLFSWVLSVIIAGFQTAHPLADFQTTFAFSCSP